MKIDVKKLIIRILIPLVLGTLVGLITGANGGYNSFIKPDFAPPAVLFPIVWSILYILMGISSYIIDNSNDGKKEKAMNSYYAQLIINLLWSFIFFSFKMYLFAFIWIILLILAVVIMIKRFYDINKLSGLLQIPYLLWLIFASILNFSIYLLNR